MGSGHILVYAFDVLMDIYREAGYTDRDAAQSILENNLYGLEIDERAYHLAYFSLLMKARTYNRRILTKQIELNLVEIKESNSINYDYLEEQKDLAKYLVETFKEAKEYGSILILECKEEECRELLQALNEIDLEDYTDLIGQAEKKRLVQTLKPLVKQALLLTQKYDVVITNPPYMGSSGMDKKLSEYVKKNYPKSKSDMSTVFMEKTLDLCRNKGLMAMINIPAWMFITSYEKLRKQLLKDNTILNMVHPGRGIFGSDFGTTCFVISKYNIPNYLATYRRLFDKQGEVKSIDERENAFLNGFGRYVTKQENYGKIPGSPIAYWVSNAMISNFKKGILISKYAHPRQGMSTCDVNRFTKLWYEVEVQKTNIIETKNIFEWVRYNKGGNFRKWYGNREYVVYWDTDGSSLLKNGALLRNREVYFKPFLAWTKISSAGTGFRQFEEGFLFDGAGGSLFINDNKMTDIYLLGMLNSKVTTVILNLISPTLNFNENHIGSIPIIQSKNEKNNDRIKKLVNDSIEQSKSDWDSFETSWDFKVHPLVKNHTSTIEEAYELWSSECLERFNTLKSNEEELNRIFIDIYGLQDELDPYVEDKDVTVRKADLVRDIKSFITYAVGCMFGRYSLDCEGLAYAGGDFDLSKYASFKPDEDNIIPICDEEYFEDDMTGRIIEFVKVVYGEETLEENLQFISSALGGKGNPREVLRNYFLKDFYKDHCNTYQVTGSGKRPIYWLFDSGKKNGFKALIYIHRYSPDLIARMRTGYIHTQQSRYRTQIEMIEGQVDHASSTSERVRFEKQLKKLKEQNKELQVYEEKIHHWADKMEPMDLDDGVKANYAKFSELLAKIK